MKMNKVLSCSFIAAMAACMVTGVTTVKAADEVTGTFTQAGVGTPTLDTTTQTLTAGASKELLVGVGKVNARKKTITVASWDSYEGSSGQTVDLSNLSNTKDNYLVLASSATDVVSVIKIPAADKAIKAAYDVKTNALQVGTGKTASEAKSALKAIAADGFEYRTAYSKWADAFADSKAVDLSKYLNQGTTLYVRAKGKSLAKDTLAAGTEELMYGEQKVVVYEGKALPGKEAKVKIAARAKGPKVALDYANGIVTLPKNSEYRGLSSDFKYDKDNSGKNVAVGAAAAKVDVSTIFSKLGESSADDMTLEVRTVADKKTASKWTRVKISKPVAISTSLITAKADLATAPDASTIDEGKTETYGGKGVAEATLKESTESNASSVLKVTYAVVSKKDVLVIENSGEKTYEIVTASDKAATEAPEGAKAVKIAPKKKVTIKNVADFSSVFVRVAGDKKDQRWVGAYSKLGVVDYPTKTVTGTKKKS